MYTNLNVISDELFDVIVKTNTKVKFSVYGNEAGVHDSISRCSGSFERMLSNIHRLQNNGVELHSNVVIMAENVLYREQIINMLKELGIKKIHVDEIRKVYGGCQAKHMLHNGYTKTKPNFIAKKEYFENANIINTCWHGRLVISSDGSVYPCEFERRILYGNINDSSIKQILESEKLKMCWYMDFAKVDECKNCEFRFACKDCRPVAFAEKGYLYEKNPRCGYKPEEGIWEC